MEFPMCTDHIFPGAISGFVSSDRVQEELRTGCVFQPTGVHNPSALIRPYYCDWFQHPDKHSLHEMMHAYPEYHVFQGNSYIMILIIFC